MFVKLLIHDKILCLFLFFYQMYDYCILLGMVVGEYAVLELAKDYHLLILKSSKININMGVYRTFI